LARPPANRKQLVGVDFLREDELKEEDQSKKSMTMARGVGSALSW
jgi:hypothetical protein